MNLEVEQAQRGEATVIYLKGELDAFTAPKLKEKLMPLVEEDNQTVGVDLAELVYMDSTGLGVFIGALKSAQKHNGQFTLWNPKDRIERLFEITGLSDVIDIKQERGV